MVVAVVVAFGRWTSMTLYHFITVGTVDHPRRLESLARDCGRPADEGGNLLSVPRAYIFQDNIARVKPVDYGSIADSQDINSVCSDDCPESGQETRGRRRRERGGVICEAVFAFLSSAEPALWNNVVGCISGWHGAIACSHHTLAVIERVVTM